MGKLDNIPEKELMSVWSAAIGGTLPNINKIKNDILNLMKRDGISYSDIYTALDQKGLLSETYTNNAISNLKIMTNNKMKEKTLTILGTDKANILYEVWLKNGYVTEETKQPEIIMEMMNDEDICEEMYECGMNAINEGSWMSTRAGANGQVFESELDDITDPISAPDLDEPQMTDVKIGDDLESDGGVVEPMVVNLSTKQIGDLSEGGELELDGVIIKHEIAEEIPDGGDIPSEEFELDESIGSVKTKLDKVISDMKIKAKEYKAAEGETKKDLLTQLKGLTDKKKGLEAELDGAVENKDKGVKPKEIDETILAENENYVPATPVTGTMPNHDAKKGLNVDSENKTNQEQYLTNRLKEIEKQSETESEKIENLRNQKHEVEAKELDQVDTMRGQSPADGTMEVEDPAYEERVEMEMKTGDSRERDEEEVGEKANIGDGKVFTEKPTGEDVSDGEDVGEKEVAKRKSRQELEKYQSEPDKTEVVNEQFSKMRHLIGFTSGETKKPKNEDNNFTTNYRKLKPRT